MAAVINEFFFNNAGTDTLEYIEVFVPAAEAGTPYYVLQVEGDVATNTTQRGRIDSVHAVVAPAGGGYVLVNLPANTLENGAFTLLLVAAEIAPGVSTADDDANDIDRNNDGVIDSPLPFAIADAVGIADGASDSTYAGSVRLFNDTGNVGGFSRLPDLQDMNANGDWLPNDQALDPNDDTDPTPDAGQARNTPGAANAPELVATPPAPSIIVTVQGLSVAEGGFGGGFSLSLATQPTADVTITITPDAELSSSSASTLVFTPANWNLEQGVAVSAVDDSDVEGTHSGTVVIGAATSTDLAYNGLDAPDQVFTITDNDVAGPTLTEISTIQGAGHRSALEGTQVTTSGIVTARSNNGFWMQDPTPDADTATSEGIFVFTSSAPAVSVGDLVQVAGTVTEFTRNTNDPGHLSVTQITAPTVTVQSSGNPLPDAVVIGTDRLPPTEITDSDNLAVFNPDIDGVDFWESLEGMRIELPDAIAVGPSFNSTSTAPVVANKAEVFAVANQGAGATGLNSDGGLTLSETDGNPERVAVQVNQNVLPGGTLVAKTGDLLGDVVGVLDYDNRGNFEIVLTQAVTVVDGGLTKEDETELAGDATTLSVGTYNVENLAGTTSAAKFTALGIDIADLMNSPDIIALQEIQDNNGTTNNGVVDATDTYTNLINAIVAAGGPTYTFLNIDPLNNTSGGAPGGNIRVGFLYNDDRVDLVEGSLRQVDPTNTAAWDQSRIPLAADFVFNGEVITVVNNHWASKGGSSPQFGTIQPLQNGSEDQRVLQAASVKGFVDGILADDANGNIIVMGDLNEFAWEDSLDIVTGREAGEQVLFDLFELSEPDPTERYEFVFDGNHQILDHVLASGALVQGGFGFDSLQVNSQFPSAQRNSDHDPAVATFTLPVPEAFPNGVASGDVDQDSAVLWALVSVVGEASFEFFPAGEEGGTVVVLEVTATNVPLKLEVNGLAADTLYTFTVTDALGRTATGSFRTAAEIGAYNGLSFGTSGDWRGELLPYPAISNADEAGLDFFVKLGDTVYADFPSPALDKPQAETVGEFRLKHAEVYSDEFWKDLHASTPIMAMIDDHEVTNDFSGGDLAINDPRVGATEGLVNDSPLYENGLQAFQDYNAIEERFYGDTGEERTAFERDLYRYNTFGSDAATFLLDARSFRDGEITAWNGTPADAGRFLAEAFTPGRTLLGKAQLDQLKADLLAADAAGIGWKFIFVPEPIQNFGPLGAGDRFEGYAAERTEILKFIDDNDIDNVVFVAADVHGTVVNNITYQTAPGGPQIALNAFEVTTGSVAFQPPFGPAAIGAASAFGLVSPQQLAFYNSLPVAPDADSVLNDKDDFFKFLLNQQLDTFGYDRAGLNDNLAQANGLINAKLLAGDYVAVHTFGWTQFDIDDASGALLVTTYGITDSNDLGQAPAIVSQFEVQKFAKAPVLAFDLWQTSVGTANGVADWRDVATNLDYTNASVAGEQRSARFDDSTGARIARFEAKDGDVAVREVDFASGGSVGPDAMTLDWQGGNAVLTLNTAWNSIKNIYLTEFAGGQLAVQNFVAAAFNFSADDADKDLLIQGSSRINGRTGAGDDTIIVEVDSDGGPVSENRIRLQTNDGDDQVEIKPSAFDWSGTFSPVPYDPAMTQSVVELGAGNDGFKGGDGQDIVTGGAGDDTLDGNGGFDTAIFAGRRADYTVSVDAGVTTVTGAAGTDTLVDFEQLRFDDAVLRFAGGIWA